MTNYKLDAKREFTEYLMAAQRLDGAYGVDLQTSHLVIRPCVALYAYAIEIGLKHFNAKHGHSYISIYKDIGLADKAKLEDFYNNQAVTLLTDCGKFLKGFAKSLEYIDNFYDARYKYEKNGSHVSRPAIHRHTAVTIALALGINEDVLMVRTFDIIKKNTPRI